MNHFLHPLASTFTGLGMGKSICVLILMFVACASNPGVHSSDVDACDETYDVVFTDDLSIQTESWQPETVTDTETSEPDVTTDIRVDADSSEPMDCGKDSDHDGVFDCDEVNAGTDPFDPSDAPAWHPEIKGYPRLFFGALDRDRVRAAVRARIKNGAGARMEEVRKRCDYKPPDYPVDLYNPYVEAERAKIAKACAFVAFVDDDWEAADKAMGILTAIRADSMDAFKGIDLNSPYYSKWDIVDAEAVESYVVAFDLLAAYGESDLDTMKTRIEHFCDAYFDFGTKGPERFLLTASQDNHGIKFGAAAALCGMMFNHRPRAAFQVNLGVTYVDFLLDYLIDDQGGDAEGPAYNMYAAVTYLPFFAAYHRLVGRTRTYKALPLLRLKPPAREQVEVRDFVNSPKLLKNNTWFLNILMPDGRAPNIDDANLTRPFAGLIAGVFHDPRYLGGLLKNSGDYRLAWDDRDIIPETLCSLAGFHDTKTVDYPALTLMETAGQAIFRGTDSSWMMVVAEHGQAVAHGGGHEQMDPTQWLYYARGQYIVIDSGYIKWEERDLVAHPKNHNMVLVDGQGPEDGPFARATEGFLEPKDEHFIAARTAYRGCSIARNYYFFNTTVAVVTHVDCDKKRTLSNLLHINAGGDTGCPVTGSNGVYRFTRAGVTVDVMNTCINAECDFSEHDAPHGFQHGHKHKHGVLAAGIDAKTAMFFNGLFAVPKEQQAHVSYGQTNDGVCFLNADSQRVIGICQCEHDTGCSVKSGDYDLKIAHGFTYFVFDPRDMQIKDFYGESSPEISGGGQGR